VCVYKVCYASNTLKLTRVGHDDTARGLAGLRAERLQLLHDVHALDNVAEHDMLAVQPGRLHRGEKELRAVRVRARVRHRQHAGAGMLEGEVLVGELLAVDRLAASSIMVGEVTALAHEVRDDTVEGRALEAEALLAGAQGAEVLSRARHHVRAELEDNSADLLAIGGHVEENTRQGHLFLLRIGASRGDEKN